MVPRVGVSDTEFERLSALQAASLLDTPPEDAFDRFTRLATELLECPVSLVTLVDHNRQFFKSAVGLSEPLASTRQTPLSHSFCKHVVQSASPLVIADAHHDPLVKHNPAVQEFGAVAYLGMPLTTKEGHTLGTLCVVDSKPRTWSPRSLQILEDLATMLMTEIELRSVGQEIRNLYIDLRDTEIARDELAQMLVHDLRNPLASMLLAVEVVQEQVTAKQRATLDIAQESGQRLLRMVGDILDVGKAKAGKMELRLEEIAPEELVRIAEEQILHSAADKRVAVEKSFEPSLGLIRVDTEKLRRVLVNLLANAIQHSPPDSVVQVSVGSQNNGEEVVFTIADHGRGIPVALEGRIFGKYFSVESKNNGIASSGLGLAFCKMATNAHGGEITYNSRPGVGTAFRIVLPKRLPMQFANS